MGNIPKISDTEWEIMKIIWRKTPVTSDEIIKELSAKKDWNPKTVKSFLNRLVNKKAIGFTKAGRNYLYHPLVTEEQCVTEESDSFLNKIYDGAIEMMFSHYLKREAFSEDEIGRIREILMSKKREN